MAKIINVRIVNKLTMARTNMDVGKLRSRLKQWSSRSLQLKGGVNVRTTNTDFGISI